MSTNFPSWQNPRLAGRIAELDGIRGLAILLVLVWHYFAITVPSAAPGSGPAFALATLGLTWTGVDLFFVLSGFLIGGILYDAKDSQNYYRTFYSRRIYRIFPLYFIWIALFMAGLYFAGHHSASTLDVTFNRELPVWSYTLFLQNFRMASQSTFGPAWMAVTWSLAVEEQFYLLLPLFVRRLSYRGLTILAVTSILSAPIVRFLLWLSGNVYMGPLTLLPCRSDALGMGVLVALACRDKNTWDWLASHRRYLYSVFILLGCGVAFLLKYQRHLYTIGLTWIAAFYALLLLLAIVNPGRLETNCFCNRNLVKLGTVAYSVYVFHQGINFLFHFAIFGGTPSVSNWPSLTVTMLSLATVILLSSASWRMLEKPLIRHAHAVYRY